MVSVHLRWPLLREERLEHEDLSEADHEDGQGDEPGPDQYALVQLLGALAALHKRKGGENKGNFSAANGGELLCVDFSTSVLCNFVIITLTR